ncbi:cytidine monophosphate-N-acetylneuraminic acid hydroxylase-like, partial [Pundamilia nyererei]|uniref:Cytidine monophosphate-N-acetylneuraminic acid hydroxylase-like n=1 Tax=Pundamilia nyererei TaxID=303518 RepID=A0A9Y3S709_9CICH
MILMDGVHPEMDTCIIVDYKGHMILNTVDCTRPNGGRLPQYVDVMMTDFAGGASGFPMTFYGGKYSDSWKAEFIKNERKKLLNYKATLAKSLQPRIYCPFAGYFVEAHPSDRKNPHNKAASVVPEQKLMIRVQVIETDDKFECITDGYDYLVDFLDLSFPTKRPDREHAYLEIKNRIGVMRYVVLHGCLWDDLYIGFQNRVSRDPDIYHH